MSTALLIIGFVLVLLIGNFMGAKPSDKEMQLDSVRMTARKLELLPKLVVMPEFLNKENSQPIKKEHYDYTDNKNLMITQYSLVNDNWQLPKAVFLIENDKLLLLNNDNSNNAKTYLERQSQKLADNAKVLDNLALPENLKNFLPFLKAVVIQANSISVFWYDEKWANGLNKRLADFNAQHNQQKTDKLSALNAFVEQELSLLKATMGEWAETAMSAKR